MEYKLIRKSELKEAKWTGGTTTQLDIFPSDSIYLERNFVWRLSTAKCQLEESVFSKLPDYDRILMVLQGDVVLAHQDVRVARLKELEQDSFDGAYNTKSFGVITDYNLMVRKGNRGELEAIELTSENRHLDCTVDSAYSFYTTAFYCRNGFATVSVNGQTLMINEGDQLVIDCRDGEMPDISLMGEGVLVRSNIWYNYSNDDMRPTVIPKEKASFDDFLTCIYLANIQFRGAKFIFPKLKNQWFDEELSKAIKKIESIYLTFFVGLIGAAAVLGLAINSFSTLTGILAVVAWILVDMFIVSPLMYMVVVPKPARKHIKDVNNLTPYEKKVRERELATNEHLEKMLKKYEKSGRVVK